MGFDPASFALDELLDLGGRYSPGCPNDHTVSGDLDTDAFPVTADQAIGDLGGCHAHSPFLEPMSMGL